MHIGNLIKISLRALGHNKMRGFLTMLGVIIGVSSVIAMLAIGQGSKESIQTQIADMGTNMLFVQPGVDNRGPARVSGDNNKTLELEDYYSLRDNSQYLAAVSPMVASGGQFIFGANNYPCTITGANSEYLSIRKLSIADGTNLNEHQITTAAKVCLLGKTVITNLFPNGENPIGKVIRFNKIPFTVIGTLKEKGANTMGMDQDNIVIAPYTTVQKRVLAITHLNTIFVSSLNDEVTEKAIDEIKTILRANHKLKDSDDDDFNIRSQKEFSAMLTSTTVILTVLLSSIAGISLLVGGIGIMNIMYVSVKERTREIGLRMSIGAKGRDILAQFLIEAIIISVTGGIIGVIFGMGISFIIKFVFSWPISIQLSSVVISFVVCTITGVFFGWYPAKNASELDPIEAIRYE